MALNLTLFELHLAMGLWPLELRLALTARRRRGTICRLCHRTRYSRRLARRKRR